ncbi:hypothetical protein THRCLA_02553 [Thraustotheca clavata]|uniref:PX domain-containing protein n=1 Tax=Thraustotheca clavata TaxID=74557 RepID=A0A1W0A4T5_9STRA|nr:hypothetical protein THRCLA_02553 [Thraustotheca clavata]
MVSCSLVSMKTSISHVATAPEHHTQYVVRVADQGNETTAWFLYKRYSEFRTLRDALQQVNLCPSCRRSTLKCIQQFPRRHFFASTSERVLDERKVRLHHFLSSITTASQQCNDAKCVSRSVLEDFLDVPSVHKGPIRLFSAAALPAVDKLGEPLSLLQFNRKERPLRLQRLQYLRQPAHSIS